MYKIVNNKVTISYNEINMKILLNKLKDDINLDIITDIGFNKVEESQVKLIDGFNFMDYQIVSEDLKKIIELFHNKNEVYYKKTNIYYQGKLIDRKYFTMLLHNSQLVSAIGDKYVDYSSDAQFPVIDMESKYNIFYDKILFFPIITEKVINKIENEKFNIKFITPLSGIAGETYLYKTPTCIFYQCLESGHIWLSDKALFDDIKKIIKKYPHRELFYKKEHNRWYPNRTYSFEYFNIISLEEVNELENFINKGKK